jgi:hypothetical protein
MTLTGKKPSLVLPISRWSLRSHSMHTQLMIHHLSYTPLFHASTLPPSPRIRATIERAISCQPRLQKLTTAEHMALPSSPGWKPSASVSQPMLLRKKLLL